MHGTLQVEAPAPSRTLKSPPGPNAPFIEPSIPVTQPVTYVTPKSAPLRSAPAATVTPPPPAPIKPEPLAGPNVMKVVFVGAECAPWSKTGQRHHSRAEMILIRAHTRGHESLSHQDVNVPLPLVQVGSET